MRQTSRWGGAALIAGLFACGGGPRGSGASESGEARTEACETLSQHLLGLARRDELDGAEPGLAEGVRAELARQCREDPWSDARRDCLRAARSQGDTLRCPAQ